MRFADVTFVAAMAAGLNVASQSVVWALVLLQLPKVNASQTRAPYIVVTAGWLAGVSGFVFLLGLYRRNASAMRRASLGAAAAMLLGCICFGMVSVRMMAAGGLLLLLPQLLWIAFYAACYSLPAPFEARPTRVLAGALVLVSCYETFLKLMSLWSLAHPPATVYLTPKWELLPPPHAGWLHAPLAVTSLFHVVTVAMVMLWIAKGRRSNAVEGLQNLAR